MFWAITGLSVVGVVLITIKIAGDLLFGWFLTLLGQD